MKALWSGLSVSRAIWMQSGTWSGKPAPGSVISVGGMDTIAQPMGAGDAIVAVRKSVLPAMGKDMWRTNHVY